MQGLKYTLTCEKSYALSKPLGKGKTAFLEACRQYLTFFEVFRPYLAFLEVFRP